MTGCESGIRSEIPSGFCGDPLDFRHPHTNVSCVKSLESGMRVEADCEASTIVYQRMIPSPVKRQKPSDPLF